MATPPSSEDVGMVLELMGRLRVTATDIMVYQYIEARADEYAEEAGDDLVFKGTVNEAFDRFVTDGFNLWDDPRWAEASYDYERDKVTDMLREVGILTEREKVTDRPTTDCGCGYPLIWVEGAWQHDAAPYLWGDDHSPDEPAPTGPAREYWDAEDGVTI